MIAGAGEVEAEDLHVQTMHINCAGASKAEVNVARELWAQAAGASKITYKGTPHIKQNMAVGGSVIKKELYAWRCSWNWPACSARSESGPSAQQHRPCGCDRDRYRRQRLHRRYRGQDLRWPAGDGGKLW